jgi:predicted nucleic acid-binding protein
MNIIPDIKTSIFRICEDMDSRVAVTALALDAILVTADSDFQRIVGLGLRLEDWTR